MSTALRRSSGSDTITFAMSAVYPGLPTYRRSEIRRPNKNQNPRANALGFLRQIAGDRPFLLDWRRIAPAARWHVAEVLLASYRRGLHLERSKLVAQRRKVVGAIHR